MRKIVVICLMGLLSAFSGLRAEFPLRSTGGIIFEADVCQFEGSDSRTALELYYSVKLGPLIEAGISGIRVDLWVRSSQRDTVASVSREYAISNYSAEDNLLDIFRIELLPDSVQLAMRIRDLNGSQSGGINTALRLRSFDKQFSVSDLMLVSRVQRTGTPNGFSRHGVDLLPSPSRLFHSLEDPLLFFYLEQNKMHFSIDEKSTYSLRYVVENTLDKEVRVAEKFGIAKTGSASSRIEKISLDGLSSGRYLLRVWVTDNSSQAVASAEKSFRVFTPGSSETEVLPMTDADIRRYELQIKYIATSEELRMFKRLDRATKSAFLLDLWKSRDPNPATPENEFMIEHFQTLAYCEEHFRGGIDCDRARVLIQYGPPLEISRQASAFNSSRGVEVWHYAANGNTEFVFVDRIGNDEYYLLHSTHPDELSNPDWAAALN